MINRDEYQRKLSFINGVNTERERVVEALMEFADDCNDARPWEELYELIDKIKKGKLNVDTKEKR